MLPSVGLLDVSCPVRCLSQRVGRPTWGQLVGFRGCCIQRLPTTITVVFFQFILNMPTPTTGAQLLDCLPA